MRARRGALLPAVVAGLIALVALAAASHGVGSGSRGRGPSAAFYDYAFTIVLTLAVLAAILIGALAIRERQLPERRQDTVGWRRELKRMLIAGLVVLALLLIHPHRLGRLANLGRSNPAQHQPGGPGAGRHLQPDQRPHLKATAALPIVAVVLVGLAAATIASRRRRASFRGKRAGLAEELAQAFDDLLDDLVAEPDPRRAIVAAYARWEKLLAAHGLPRRASEAPLEYLTRVLDELQVSGGPALALTDLFERAKFSPHVLGRSAKEEAIQALVSVRDELLQAPAAELSAA